VENDIIGLKIERLHSATRSGISIELNSEYSFDVTFLLEDSNYFTFFINKLSWPVIALNLSFIARPVLDRVGSLKALSKKLYSVERKTRPSFEDFFWVKVSCSYNGSWDSMYFMRP